MSVAIKGNQTINRSTPGANFRQRTHNHNTGSDGLLILSVIISNGNNKNFTGATYNGVAMTGPVYNENRSIGARSAFYYMINPPSGQHLLRINFNKTNHNLMSFYARSFTGSGGIGNHYNSNGTIQTPINATLTTSADSLITMSSVSNVVNATMQIPTGTSVAKINHNINKRATQGSISTNGFPAQNTNLRVTVNNNQASLDAVEILGLSSSSGGESNFFMIM